MKWIGLALALLSLAVGAGAAEGVASGQIKTSTVGIVGVLSPFFSALLGNKHGVVSPDAPDLAAKFADRMVKRGFTLYATPEITKDSDVYVIIRDYRGKAADYVPQTAEIRMGGGGWGSAIASLGLGVLVGKNLGTINTNSLLMSDANAVANLVQRTGDADGNPGQNEDRAKAKEGVKDERNLVAFRLCFRGQCAHALSAGDASVDDLEDACFRDGILKLAGLEE